MMLQYGGASGIHNIAALESALAQPRQSFGGSDLYPSLAEKAAALGFSLIQNHAFVDGNKRIAHAVMETFLVLNGHEFQAGVAEQETVILEVAAGIRDRDSFTVWVQQHIVPRADT
jgi:death-on-curing protein